MRPGRSGSRAAATRAWAARAAVDGTGAGAAACSRSRAAHRRVRRRALAVGSSAVKARTTGTLVELRRRRSARGPGDPAIPVGRARPAIVDDQCQRTVAGRRHWLARVADRLCQREMTRAAISSRSSVSHHGLRDAAFPPSSEPGRGCAAAGTPRYAVLAASAAAATR